MQKQSMISLFIVNSFLFWLPAGICVYGFLMSPFSVNAITLSATGYVRIAFYANYPVVLYLFYQAAVGNPVERWEKQSKDITSRRRTHEPGSWK